MKQYLRIFLALSLLLLYGTVAHAQGGDPDPTFDGDGTTITDMGGGDKINAIA